MRIQLTTSNNGHVPHCNKIDAYYPSTNLLRKYSGVPKREEKLKPMVFNCHISLLGLDNYTKLKVYITGKI